MKHLIITFGSELSLRLSAEQMGEELLIKTYNGILNCKLERNPVYEINYKDDNSLVYQKTMVNTFAIKFMQAIE
jgi:hypothetical protein